MLRNTINFKEQSRAYELIRRMSFGNVSLKQCSLLVWPCTQWGIAWEANAESLGWILYDRRDLL